MSIRVEVFDGTTPMLEKITVLSYGMALESLSVAGAAIQEEARAALRSKSHHWFQDFSSGRRVIRRDYSQLRQLGLRISQKDGTEEDPASMANFINSYLMEKSLTVVVGGKHPSFTPKKRDGGVVTGPLNRVSGTSKASHAILHKLNFGERNQYHTWGGRRESMKNFANAQYVGYHFMEEGFSAARGRVVDAMTKRYESLLHKAVDRANVKIKKTVVA